MITIPPAPPITDHFIDLPLTRLHYVKCGHGPPLIMVPATISRIEHWIGLAQFMGTKFTTYFFELPGHGQSTPFPSRFSSEHVATTIEDFIDTLGHSKITLMGFSFGGILAIKTLQHLGDRVERVVLFSPNVSKHALLFSRRRTWALKKFTTFLKKPSHQKKFVSLLHNPKTEQLIISFIKKIGRVEDNVPLNTSMHMLPAATLDVLTYQLDEGLNIEHPPIVDRYPQPLHFAMSVNDPLLDFTTTYNFLDTYFSDIHSINLTFPYHQPPGYPTYEEIYADYSKFIEDFSS
ncbi:MAG: alpha/beta fold hydrolase [Chloroflexi bacterium]|nr:alpha/beta fold hydrolase [Chloroflexota bacterium]